jgi:hypothetical protein
MQQGCPLSVKDSFVTFVLPADHLHLMHMIFICAPSVRYWPGEMLNWNGCGWAGVQKGTGGRRRLGAGGRNMEWVQVAGTRNGCG